MKQIIAIGGGGFASSDSNYELERYCLAQTKKQHPKVCFLPQASNEDKAYVAKYYECFLALGANPTWLSLFGRVPHGWQEKIFAADLIYVGGGNTRSMLALWREWGVDLLLKEAYERGAVLSGISAGAICWYEACVTDSVWPLGTLEGLNLISGACCPHYDSEPERRPTFLTKVKDGSIIPGIALQDGCAAHYQNGKLHKVVTNRKNKSAFQVTAEGESTIACEYIGDR